MKIYFIVITVLGLSLASCSTKKTDFSKLQERNGIIYLMNSDKPFSGEVEGFNKGTLEFEGSIKGGLRDGVWTYYFPNGQKNFEGIFKEGVKEGKWSFWKDNGQESEFEMYKYGELINGNQKKDSTQVDSTKKHTTPNQTSIPYVAWEQLKGSSIKTYKGSLFKGGFIKYYSTTGIKSLVGYYRNGERSGRWTFYDKKGNIKDVKNY